MKNIVVPIDFSECSLNALKVAADIAKKASATIQMVHVNDNLFEPFPITTSYDSTNKDIRWENSIKSNILDRKAEKLDTITLLPYLKGIRVEKYLLNKVKVSDIVNEDFIQKADMIIMGSHGCSGWKELFIGSNTEKIVRLSQCPVLAIRNPIEQFKMESVVFASDFEEQVEKVFVRINKLFNLFESKIHLLKVNTRNNFDTTIRITRKMRRFIRLFNLECATMNVFDDNTIEEGILHFSNSNHIDLITMETHGRTGITHLINGSITENVVNHVSLPVLSVKINENSCKDDD